MILYVLANCNVLQRQNANIVFEILIKSDCLLELAKSATHPGAVLHIKHGRVLGPLWGPRPLLGVGPNAKVRKKHRRL